MPEVLPQTYEMQDITALREHPQNPRRGDVNAISESLDANGFYGAIIVQKATGYILKGNHTFRVAKDKGLTQVPVIVIDVDDVRAKSIMLADNRIPELANYDPAALRDLLDVVHQETESYLGTGFDDDAYNLVLNQINQEGDLSFVNPDRYDVTNTSDEDIDDPEKQTSGESVVPRSETDAGMVSFTLVLEPEQRDVLLKAARQAKQAFDVETTSEAIYEICNAFVEADT